MSHSILRVFCALSPSRLGELGDSAIQPARCQDNSCLSSRQDANMPGMDVRELARLGGLARAKSMTAEERRKLATKASRAAARARTKKAKAKKKEKKEK